MNFKNQNEDSDNKRNIHFDGNNQLGTILEEKTKIKRPSLYKVIMLNDDYTPMEFVVEMLQTYFSKSSEEATRIMLHIHQRGVGICGLYTYEIAESKATQVLEIPWYFDVSSWSGLKKWLGSDYYLDKPPQSILSYHEWNPIGVDNEQK